VITIQILLVWQYAPFRWMGT